MIVEGSYKAAKGLIKIKANVELGILKEIQISGDFFMYPEDGLWDLEGFLAGTEINREQILTKIVSFYKKSKILSPGVVPEDFVEAILKAEDTSTLSDMT